MFSIVSLNHVFYGYQITVSVMKSDQNSNINRKSETGTHSPGFPQGEAERGRGPFSSFLSTLFFYPYFSSRVELLRAIFPPLYLMMYLDTFPALLNHGWKQFLFKVG